MIKHWFSALSLVHNTQKAVRCNYLCCVPSDKAITINVSSRSVISGVANDGCYGHGLDFGRFLSYSSTHGTTGGVHSIWLDAND